METNTKILDKSKSKVTLAQKIILGLFENMKKGQLTILLPNGESKTFGKTDEIKANVIIKSNEFFNRCLYHGDIGFGEAYVDGLWETDSISNVIRWMILNIEDNPNASGSKAKSIAINILGFLNRIKHLANSNSEEGSKKNISYHYDLSNDLYNLFLDETMTYSCGMFDNDETSLKQAQENKYRLLCEKLNLKETDHVLEIGCGWGGFAEFAAQNYGCKITGVTVSKEQLDYAQKRIKDAGLEDKVSLIFKDYRKVEGRFDKVVSIEMIEAVGHEYLPEYFRTIAQRLKPNGIVAIQAITSPDSRYDEFRKGVDWIQKHIFPGSLLPAVGEMNRVINKETDLQLHQITDYGIHYAKTLNTWFKRFNNNFDEIKKLGFDERFRKKWNYYLQYCEAAFYMRNIGLVQMVLTRPNNQEMDKDFTL